MDIGLDNRKPWIRAGTLRPELDHNNGRHFYTPLHLVTFRPSFRQTRHLASHNISTIVHETSKFRYTWRESWCNCVWKTLYLIFTLNSPTIYYLWALKGQWANTIPPQIMICPNVHLAQFFVSMTYCVHYIIMCLIFHHLVFLSTLLTFISKSYKPVTKHLLNVLIVKSEYVFLLSETHTFYLVAIFHRTLIWRTT